MAIENKVPAIRFKGFNGEWEDRTLETIYNKIRNAFVGTATPYYVKDGNFYLESNNVKDGKINRNTEVFINDDFYQKQSDKWLCTGDIVMVQSGHVGHTAVIPPELNNTAAHALIMFTDPKEKINPHFLNFQFQTTKSKKKLSEITTGNTIKHILSSEMKEFHVSLPHDKEQDAVGRWFQEVDTLIALHQQKHDKLLNLKKSLLEKMFPKQSEKEPEIRFKRFSGEWIDRSLDDVSIVSTGFPFDSNDFDESGEYLVITNGNIQNDLPIVDASIGNRIDVEENSKLNEYVLNAGDILVTMDGTVGRVAKVLDKKQILAQRVGRLTAKLESEFLYQLLCKVDFFKTMTLISHGGTIKHISLNEIGGYKSFFPKDIEEQTKIGNFFKQLDELLNQHQVQLDKLNNIKQACLEKMFV